jgi:hypothetical protein
VVIQTSVMERDGCRCSLPSRVCVPKAIKGVEMEVVDGGCGTLDLASAVG